jgi:dipeptidyl aminopeptidase/acylaminoacyl peptidase
MLAASPDGQWSVTLLASDQVSPDPSEIEQFPNGKYHVEMVVEHVDGSRVWTAVDEWRGWGLGLTYPEAVRWSTDGRYFYFANVPIPDGCGIFVNGGDLWQLDLENGQMKEIAPYIGLVMALSPDETQLAVNASYGRGFLIRDLATGEEQAISLPELNDQWKISGLQWSPNGQYLLLVQLLNPCGSGDKTTAIVRIDRNDLSATTVVEPGKQHFSLQEWVQDDVVKLQDEAGIIWNLDVFSGELTMLETAVPPDQSTIQTGATILFARDNDLWRIDAGGQNEQRLTEGQLLADWQLDELPAADPWWAGGFPPQVHVSPDGRWLAFTQTGRNLVLVDVTGAAPPRFHNLTGSAVVFTWSPDSQRLAYSSRSGIVVYDVSVDGSVQIFNEESWNLVWSPDGRFLAFACCFEEPDPGPYDGVLAGEIKQIELVSGQVKTVGETRKTVGGGTPPICWSVDGAVGIEVVLPATCSHERPYPYTFSPDSTQQAYLALRSPEDEEYFRLLAVKDVVTDETVWQREVPLVQKVYWSSDGRHLLLGNDAYAPETTIYRIPADGSSDAEILLTDALLLDIIPAWEQ